MRRLTTPLLSLCFAMASSIGCGDPGEPAEGSLSTGSSITITANLVKDENGQIPFMTPAASAVRVDPSELVGRPYYGAVFEGGFAPGIDPPRHFVWGRLQDNLAVEWTTPADLADGPYDIVFVLYRATEVSDETFGGRDAAVAINGDLATFTISTEDVLPDDPPLTAGVLRVNIAGGDAFKAAENRWTDDLSDTAAGTMAFTDTILLVP